MLDAQLLLLQHSDLKPDNVMFRAETDDAVICDLGVGRITGTSGGAATSTVHHGHGGTLVYLAPELVQEEDLSATHKSDM